MLQIGTAIFILALGTSVSTSALLDRVWATLVGAVIGAAASYVAYPGDLVPERVVPLPACGAIADLLSEMSAGWRGRRQPPRPMSGWPLAWVGGGAGAHAPLGRRGGGVPSCGPFGRKTASTELSRALAALTHSVAQLRAIARTLFDHQIDGAPRLPASLAEVLSRTAVAYRAQAKLCRETPRAWTPRWTRPPGRGESLRSLRGWTRPVHGSSPVRSSPKSTG